MTLQPLGPHPTATPNPGEGLVCRTRDLWVRLALGWGGHTEVQLFWGARSERKKGEL